MGSIAADPRRRVRRLRCSVQNYDWGLRGRDSTVARLFSRNSNRDFDPDRPYAELWMGTHGSGPSFVVPDGDVGKEVSLRSWILENPNVVGEKALQKWGSDLPFLFKVLSVSKALSIQAHPDKDLAGLLHKMRPHVYKDSNHKPEMAVAVTEFRALCGFVSLQELKVVLTRVPEIAELVGSDYTSNLLQITEQNDKVKDFLKSFFTKFMTADKEAIAELTVNMKHRLTAASKVRLLSEKERLALELEKQYPADVGVLSSFFFNYIKLNPGEALYLGPNEPHAYLSGECIECMATSDNVVRAGLTPKFLDVETLCSMLTYKQGFPEILKGDRLNQYTSRYIPPFDEFEVDCCSLPPRKFVVYPAVPGPSLFVVITGSGDFQVDSSEEREIIMEGDVLFVPAVTEIRLNSSAAGPLQLYRAAINERFFK